MILNSAPFRLFEHHIFLTLVCGRHPDSFWASHFLNVSVWIIYWRMKRHHVGGWLRFQPDAFGEAHLCLLKRFLLLKYLQTILFSFYIKYLWKKMLEKLLWVNFWGHPYCSNSTKTSVRGPLLNVTMRKYACVNNSNYSFAKIINTGCTRKNLTKMK